MKLKWNQWRDVSEGTGGPGAAVTALPWSRKRIATFITDPNGGIYNTAGTLYQWGTWASVSEGGTRPGGTVTAVLHREQVALFVADANGGVYTAAGTPDAGYGPWASVSEGSTTPGAPVTAVAYGARIALFLADPNGGVYATAGSPFTDWGPWASVSEGSTKPGAPIAAVPYRGRIAVFLADPAGGVYTTAGTPDTGFGPWASVSQGSTTPGGAVTAVPYGQRIALFLADPNGGVYTASGTPDEGWSGWSTVRDGSTVPGARIAVVALPWDSSRLGVFVTDPGGGVFWTVGTPPNEWQPWTAQAPRPSAQLSGGSPIALVAAYRQPGDRTTLVLLTTTGDGRVVYTNAEPPAAPESFRVTGVSAHQIDVAWSGTRTDADGVRIRYHGTRPGVADHDDERSFDADRSSASLNELLSGYQYTIRIVAFNAIGESVEPQPVTATVPIVPEIVEVTLQRQQIISGPVPYLGKYPEFGQVPAGHLLKITLPQDSGRVVGVSLVKRGHSTDECGSANAVVILGRGQSTTADQLKDIYGVSSPAYSSSSPAVVLACAATTEPASPIVDSVRIELTIISDGA